MASFCEGSGGGGGGAGGPVENNWKRANEGAFFAPEGIQRGRRNYGGGPGAGAGGHWAANLMDFAALSEAVGD